MRPAMLTRKDYLHLRELYNRLSHRHGDGEDEFFMQNVAQSLRRVQDLAYGQTTGAMAVTERDAVHISFLYNRLIHVFSESAQQPFMQHAREAFGRLEGTIWPGRVRRPADMTGLLNDGLSPRR